MRAAAQCLQCTPCFLDTLGTPPSTGEGDGDEYSEVQASLLQASEAIINVISSMDLAATDDVESDTRFVCLGSLTLFISCWMLPVCESMIVILIMIPLSDDVYTCL
jgi:hypothetical protein